MQVFTFLQVFCKSDAQDKNNELPLFIKISVNFETGLAYSSVLSKNNCTHFNETPLYWMTWIFIMKIVTSYF